MIWVGCVPVEMTEAPPPVVSTLPECGDLGDDCEALPPRIDAQCGPVGDVWPERLADTGCVRDGPPWDWIEGALPFEVNAPLWTDGSVKERVLLLSRPETITVNEDGTLEFPVGAVIGKRFSLELEAGSKTVEIRFLRRTSEDWDVVSYAFDGDEPTLVGVDPREVRLDWTTPPTVWLYPGELDCLACHRVDPVLGPTMAQLNRGVDYTQWRANQLVAFDAIGLFDPPLQGSVDERHLVPDPYDTSTPLEDRARGVLHGNCGHCHQPGGWSPPDLALDLRWDTTLEDTHACDEPVLYTTMGTGGELVFAAGDPENSNGLQRMKTRGPGQMPMFGTYVVDPFGVDVVERWIASLSGCQ